MKRQAFRCLDSLTLAFNTSERQENADIFETKQDEREKNVNILLEGVGYKENWKIHMRKVKQKNVSPSSDVTSKIA